MAETQVSASRSCVAVIVGLSGLERYLGDEGEVPALKRARRFRSERSADEAARIYLGTQAPCIQRLLKYRVEPIAHGRSVA